MPLFAVQVGGGYVEVRKATSPPIKNISRVVREICVPAKLAAELGVASPHKVEIKNISFAGGKPLLTVSQPSLASAHRRITKEVGPLPPFQDGVLKLPYTSKALLQALKEAKTNYWPVDVE